VETSHSSTTSWVRPPPSGSYAQGTCLVHRGGRTRRKWEHVCQSPKPEEWNIRPPGALLEERGTHKQIDSASVLTNKGWRDIPGHAGGSRFHDPRQKQLPAYRVTTPISPNPRPVDCSIGCALRISSYLAWARKGGCAGRNG
jgi:hypothetical protein